MKLTPRAFADINEIVEYIAERSGVDRAQDIRARFIDGLKRLERSPMGCRPSTKIPHGRDLLFQGLPYVAPFVMAERRGMVIAVYHSRQDWHL